VGIDIRPLGPGDREAFRRFVGGLSAASRLNRFMSPVRELPEALLERLVRHETGQHAALAAIEDGRIVGEGRWVRLGESDRAEFALCVADAWQHRGLARRLLAALQELAQQAGLGVLEGEILAGNEPMLRLLRRAGFLLRRNAADRFVVHAERPVEPIRRAA
jgi:acetyltransferase